MQKYHNAKIQKYKNTIIQKLRNSASSFHWLSSSIFSCSLSFVRPSRIVTSPLISLKSKKFKKQSAFIFEFWFWKDPPHPVNWSPTHSTVPQTLFNTDISVPVAQIKKNKKQSPFIFEFCFWEDPPHPQKCI